MNQREHKAYVDNNEQLLFPTLVCQRDTKKTLQLSAGIFLEVNHPDANPEPTFWHQNESGFWERQDKVKLAIVVLAKVCVLNLVGS